MPCDFFGGSAELPSSQGWIRLAHCDSEADLDHIMNSHGFADLPLRYSRLPFVEPLAPALMATGMIADFQETLDSCPQRSALII